MTSRGKKIFIALSIIIPFGIYSSIYYQEKFRYANYKAKDFVSFEYKWGIEKALENSYNSATGEYRYHDQKDSLVVKKVMLTKADFKFLDSIGDRQGVWNLPPLFSESAILANSEADLNNPKILRYEMKFVYKNAQTDVLYLSNYDLKPRKQSAAAEMQKVIEQLLNDAERRNN
jgi:hypothetical protein